MQSILKYFTEFTSQQISQFEKLKSLYNEWNEKINVISRKDIGGLYEKHILHSLSIAAAFEFSPGTTIIDIGTGGGFPGIPLAIFFPECSFHLVDSIAKKLKVVEDIASQVGLTNLTTQHTRAEEIKGRKFDFAVSRAVASLKDLWHWSRPLLNRQPAAGNSHSEGGLICLKGGDLSKEIQESGLRPHVVEIHQLFPEEYFREKYLLHVSR
jgi:16S rRNA (guanine527-N7)-methyltransferase